MLETLVCIGIVVILLALLLPAILASRNAALTLRCQSHLQQLGLAIASYEAVARCLPPGVVARYQGPYPVVMSAHHFVADQSYLVRLLPYLDEKPWYDEVNTSLWIHHPANMTSNGRRNAIFLCPLESSGGWGTIESNNTGVIANPGTTNYVGNMGSLAVSPHPVLFPPNYVVPAEAWNYANGVFNNIPALRLSDVNDGLSHTVFLSERPMSRFLTFAQQLPRRFHAGFGIWNLGLAGETLYAGAYPPNTGMESSRIAPEPSALGSGSNHTGGVHVLFGDNSVRFFSDSVDSWDWREVYLSGTFQITTPPPGLWQRLHNRMDGG